MNQVKVDPASPAPLRIGDSVWYRDVRYWLERVPDSFDGVAFVRISDRPLSRDGNTPTHCVSFAVPAVMVTPAPTTNNRYARQPTKAALATRERQKISGIDDCGDEVAILMRDCKGLDGAYELVARRLCVPEDTLRHKYGHLNPGQQRMCVSNLLRNFIKKGE